MRTTLVTTLATLSGLLTLTAQADVIQLSNGDTLHGKVITVNGEQLQFQSELLGMLMLDRAKVTSIHFGDVQVPAALPAGPAVPAMPPNSPAPANSVEDLLKQLQTEGVDPQDVQELKKQFPLLANPAVSGYFNQTLSDLMTGKMSVQDLRQEAIKARDELEGLKKDLGPDGAALDGYLNILNGFIQEAGGPEPPAQPAPPANLPPEPRGPPAVQRQ